MTRKTIFFKSKKHFPGILSSPTRFRFYVRKLNKHGMSVTEFRELNLAKNRAKVISQNPRIKPRIRSRFKKISKIRIPKPKGGK